METVLTQTVPAETKINATTVQANAVPKEDLITRASKVNLDKPIEAAKSAEDSIKLDQATIDKIADPALKEAVIQAHKSMQADYTRKTQDLALRRKEMDSLKTQLEQSGQYTPAKIQEMLSNPSFVQAAQEFQRINGGQTTSIDTGELTPEEFSYLPTEQQKLYTSTQEVKKTNEAILSKLNSSEQARLFQEQDSALKQKYGEHYKPATVDEIYQGMMSGKIQATREHLWKVADYESFGERCYKIGLEDRKLELGEKINASSQPNTISATSFNGDVPTKLPNESNPDYFRRVAQNAMKKVGVIK